MKTFEKINTSIILVNQDKTKKVVINKVSKVGTKRVFFQPLIDGEKIITTRLFAVRKEAENLAKMYLNN